METAQETSGETLTASTSQLSAFEPHLLDWRATRIFAEKNLRIAFRYPTNWIVWGFLPIMWLAPYILMMTAIAGPGTSTNFQEVSGFNDFVRFAVIGWFVYQYVERSVWSIGNNFRWEQFSGTLEPLFVTPVPRMSILVGAALADTVQCTMSAMMLLVFSSFLFGVSYVITMIAPIVVIMTLMVLALYGFSFLLAGLIMVFKDPSVLSELVANTLFVLSPVTYPVQALPPSVRFAAYLVPSTIAIVTVRELAINGVFELFSFLQSVALLLLVILTFWGLGLVSFNYAERWVKDRGSMGDF
ncbi:MAG: ABC transporter permease [Candidatus Thorarchaeota archaeon]|nr:ABC transporter permease [Candidatus Thorarchaeota archaeon]